MTLRVYKDVEGFYYQGVYKTLFFENLELLDYENISFVQGVYDQGESVEFGDVLEEGDPRGRRLLKILNKLNNEYIWVSETKERIYELAGQTTGGSNGSTMGTIVNVYNTIATAGGEAQELFNPTEGFSTEIVGIGRAKIFSVEKGGDRIVEYKGKAAFDETDLPTGKTYKVDAANDILYWGDGIGPNERFVIESDTTLQIA